MIPHNQIRVFYTQVLSSWGYTIRYHGASAAQPAYLLPPPTSIVGAFTQPIARLLELNPYSTQTQTIDYGNGKLITPLMKPFLEATITASAGLVTSEGDPRVGLAFYQEIGRLIATMYKGTSELDRIKKAKFMSSEFFEDALPRALPVQAVGAVYAPLVRMELLWVFDALKLSKELNISLDQLDKVADKAAYGLTRIGSKEGIVAIDPSKTVYDKSPKILTAGEKVRTRLYVESNCVEPLDPRPVYQIVIPGMSYSDKLYYIGARFASNTIIFPLREGDPPPLYRVLTPCKAVSTNIPTVVGVYL